MDKKTAIITGASRGIGAAIAVKFIQKGYDVIGTSTTGMGKIEGIKEWLVGDFTSASGLSSFIKLLDNFDNINVLVNNAGINIIKSQKEITTDDYDKIQRINLEAPYRISQKLIPKMAKNGEGKVVNIASIWSVISKIHRSLYSTTKTGLLGMTRSTALEWASKNILVNSISPGFVKTEMTNASLDDKQIDKMINHIPIKRFASPDEIAEVVFFLCSEKNTYLTGQNLVIDGGFTIV